MFDIFKKKTAKKDLRELRYINEEGEEVLTTVDDYVNDILNVRIEKSYQDKDALYEIILDVYDKGIDEYLERAINRLYELEKSERSINLKSKFLANRGDYADAIKLIKKIYDTNSFEDISYTTHHNLAKYYDALDSEDALTEYRYAISKSSNPKEIIEDYLNYIEKTKKSTRLETLEELAKMNNYITKYMYVKEISDNIKQKKIRLENYRQSIISNTMEAIKLSRNNLKVIKDLAKILLDLDMITEYCDNILELYDNSKDIEVTKQILQYYIKSQDYDNGFKYLYETILNDFSKSDLKELVKCENRLLEIKYKNKIKKDSSLSFKTFKKPIVRNLYPKEVEIQDDAKNEDDKHIFLIPISSYGIHEEEVKKYNGSLLSIQTFLFEQIYTHSKLNIKCAILQENDNIPLNNKIKYDEQYLKNLANSSIRVNYIIYGILKKYESNMYNIYIYMYDTKENKSILLANNILRDNDNNDILKDVLDRISEITKENILRTEYDKTNQELYNKLLDYIMNFNNTNRYRLCSIKYNLVNLLDKFHTLENSDKDDNTKLREIIEVSLQLGGLLFLAKEYNNKLFDILYDKVNIPMFTRLMPNLLEYIKVYKKDTNE